MSENSNGETTPQDSQTTAQQPDSVEPKKTWREERRDERQTRREKRREWRQERREWRHENNPYGAVVWAIILITVGIIFLLNNLGILPWGIWSNMWRFWPIFLVLIGMQIILGKSRIAALFIALLTLLLCGGVTVLAAFITVRGTDLGGIGLNLNSDWLKNVENSLNINLNANQLTKTDTIKEDDYENIKSRDFGVVIGSGSFTLTDSSSVDYFSAESKYTENYGVPVLDSSASNSKLKIDFSTRDNANFNLFNMTTNRSYDLNLGRPSIVTDLDVDLASGSGDINLNSVLLNDAKINVSSGTLNMTLREDSIPAGDFTMHLSSGNLNLDLPDDINLEVDYTVSSGSLTIQGTSVSKSGTFKSTAASSTARKLKLTVDVSSGSMEID